MSLPVIVSPEAERQIGAIDVWWRTNRPAAPQLFVEELAEAFTMIEYVPEVGQAISFVGRPSYYSRGRGLAEWLLAADA